MTPKLSIIILTIEKRENFFNRLMNLLVWQREQLSNPDDVEFVVIKDNGENSTGVKSNMGIAAAKGEYVCRFDDDDVPTDVYLKKQLEVANSGADCGEFNGLYFLNGKYDRPFIHSIKYDHWWQDDKFYYRTPNHLSAVKKSLIIDIPYPDKYEGEDGTWAMDVYKSGRLKNEYPVKETLYLYYDRTKVNGI